MKRISAPTDFAMALHRYFTRHLTSERGCSPETIRTYRRAFVLLVQFVGMKLGLSADEVSFVHLDRKTLTDYFEWLETDLGSSVGTRNNRLAALRSFGDFVRWEYPEQLVFASDVSSIKMKKRPEKEMSYINQDQMARLLGKVDRGKADGERDYILLLLMLTTGIRVSEAIGIRGFDVRIEHPATVTIHGKGGKVRHVPILSRVHGPLKQYLERRGRLRPQNMDDYIFQNHSGHKLTRQGVNYLLGKYVAMLASEEGTDFPKDLSPHGLRHSAAMWLVENDVDLVVIRDLLGHASVQTTQIYAKASARKQREALEQLGNSILPAEAPEWEDDSELLAWLNSFLNDTIL